MKKIFLLSLAMVAAFLNVFAGPIQTYQDLTSAIRAGNRFVILLDLQECTGKCGMPVGYWTPTVMMLIPASDATSERVATSFLHFSDHLGYPIYEYVKYTFHSDNAVTIRTTYYDPQNFKPIGATHTINCLMGKGIEIYSDSDHRE